jgi:hypothetical protein
MSGIGPNHKSRLSRRSFLKNSAAVASAAAFQRIACFGAATSVAGDESAAYPFSIDQDRLHGAPDFSWLNHPLTGADRLQVQKGHFYRIGDQGVLLNGGEHRNIHLYGVTLFFGKTVSDASLAPKIAKRLRRLGVNLARIPSGYFVDKEKPFPTLDDAGVARFRQWVDALKAEGIYLDLILHNTGYTFKPTRDGLPALSTSPEEIPLASKIFIFYPRLVELQVEYARKLLTAIALKNDPGLALVEIFNEGSLLRAWQTGDVDRYLAGEYEAEFARQWNQYLKSRYGETAALRAAWNPGAAELNGLAAGESLEAANVSLVRAKDNLTTSEPRLNDFLEFLLSRDKAYWDMHRQAVHETLDPLVPVSATQMWYGGLLNLDAQHDMDYFDLHFYEDHPSFPGRDWDLSNWRIRDSSAIGGGLKYCLDCAATRVAGAPFTISEYNQPWPNSYNAEIDPTMAVFGAFQDWDSLVHFCYSAANQEEPQPIPRGMSLSGNWEQFANLGQSALAFRSGAIQAGKQPLEIAETKDTRLKMARMKKSHPMAGWLHQNTGYDETIALIHPVGLVRAEDRPAAPPLPPAGSSPYTSDTGEMTYHMKKLFLAHAPQAAGVFGFLGVGNKVSAGAIDLELAPGARGFVTLFLTALDHKPLHESRHMLLSLPGYTYGTQPGSDPPRPQKMVHYDSQDDWWTLEKAPHPPGKPPGIGTDAVPPAWLERVESFLTLRTAIRKLKVFPLDGAGERLTALGGNDVQKIKGGLKIHLHADGQPKSPWFEFAAS